MRFFDGTDKGDKGERGGDNKNKSVGNSNPKSGVRRAAVR